MLDNQVAIVTGSGRGIGREVAEMFAEHGASVVVSDLDEEKASETITAIREKGGEAISYCGDVTKVDFSKGIINETIKSFGRLDILVNNAGYTWDSMVHKMTDEQFQAMLDVHLIAPFRLIRESAPYMREAGKKDIENGEVHYRKIVNVSSLAGIMANIGQANYCSAKAGVIGLTKTVAKEWGKYNVNCNAVAFGMIDTRLTRPKDLGENIEGIELGIPEKIRTMVKQTITLRRPGEAREAAEGIFYLSSPLSNYVNGHVLNISGGLYM